MRRVDPRLVVCLLATLLVFHAPTWADDTQAERSWRLLSELTPEERQRLGLFDRYPARRHHSVHAGRAVPL